MFPPARRLLSHGILASLAALLSLTLSGCGSSSRKRQPTPATALPVAAPARGSLPLHIELLAVTAPELPEPEHRLFVSEIQRLGWQTTPDSARADAVVTLILRLDKTTPPPPRQRGNNGPRPAQPDTLTGQALCLVMEGGTARELWRHQSKAQRQSTPQREQDEMTELRATLLREILTRFPTAD
jgi:hypothetical protein